MCSLQKNTNTKQLVLIIMLTHILIGMEIDGVQVDWNTIPLYTLVGQQVLLSLMDGSTRGGIVYTVDRETKNFVLIQVNDLLYLLVF
jgi:hypothetical protein